MDLYRFLLSLGPFFGRYFSVVEPIIWQEQSGGKGQVGPIHSIQSGESREEAANIAFKVDSQDSISQILDPHTYI